MRLTSDCGTDKGISYKEPNTQSESSLGSGNYTSLEVRPLGWRTPSSSLLDVDGRHADRLTGLSSGDFHSASMSSATGGRRFQEHVKKFDADYSSQRYELWSSVYN